VETGVRLLEAAFQKVGPEGTEEQFNEALGRVVPVGTTRQGPDGHAFEQVRNNFFSDEGIGRRFVLNVLPCAKLRPATVSTVLNSHYGKKKEEARRRKEEARQKEAEARRLKAEARRKAASAPRISQPLGSSPGAPKISPEQAGGLFSGPLGQPLRVQQDQHLGEALGLGTGGLCPETAEGPLSEVLDIYSRGNSFQKPPENEPLRYPRLFLAHLVGDLLLRPLRLLEEAGR
jgi:hypothetical protein